MNTAINGAATGAVRNAMTSATRSAQTLVAETASVVAPTVESAGTTVKEAGQVWLSASKSLAGLSLDAYDASVQAYLDYTTSVVAAGRAEWALELAGNNARILTNLATNYTAAARDMLGS